MSVGAVAGTGSSVGGNMAGFKSGPAAVSLGVASAQQLGRNAATNAQAAHARSGDSVAGGEATAVAGDRTTVHASNVAVVTRAASGRALLVNALVSQLGPLALSGGVASARQSGPNALELSQSGVTRTGDAVGGSQVTGVTGEGTHRITAANDAVVGDAASGPATAANADLSLTGPLAVSILSAAAAQLSDDRTAVSQSASAATGDATAGAQVTGGIGGSAAVIDANSCVACSAGTTSAFGLNAYASLVSPWAASVATSLTQQSGDDRLVLSQDAGGTTGDATSGTQVTGWAGDDNGHVIVANQQTTAAAAALSGGAGSANVNVTQVGPGALAVFVAATDSQVGGNDAAITQALHSSGGDALAGSQVTGVVGGDVAVTQINRASVITSHALPVGGTNASVIFPTTDAHPLLLPAVLAVSTVSAQAAQAGDDRLWHRQLADVESGDAVSGAQVAGITATGAATVLLRNDAFATAAITAPSSGVNLLATKPGPVAIGGAGARTLQAGDSTIDAAQSVGSASGDAVAGSQTIGVAAARGAMLSTVQDATLTLAVSGASVAENDAFAEAGGALSIAALDASASQTGDSATKLDQRVTASSGDATSAAQIAGVTSGTDAAVQGSQSTQLAAASAGMASSLNAALAGSATDAAAGAHGYSSQGGDNTVTLDQSASAAGGDAVGGSQITGVVVAESVAVSLANSAVFTVALGSSALAVNAGEAEAGPVAVGGLGAHSQQLGGNDARSEQSVVSSSGDSVSGSQVTGTTSGAGRFELETSVDTVASLAVGGPGLAANLGDTTGGPVSLSLVEAGTAQLGDDTVTQQQVAAASSGDAVAGTQVEGVAAGHEIASSGRSASAGTIGASGRAVARNLALVQAGPVGAAVLSAGALHVGDETVGSKQSASGSSGDAVSGSQVAGVAAADAATRSGSNVGVSTLAFASPASGLNAAGELAISVPALGATAQVDGHGQLTASQEFSSPAGDAVAGSQVTGRG